MNAILVLLLIIVIANQTPIQAAPSGEPCPPDSFQSEDVCKCDPNTCKKPPCLSELQVVANGTEIPGQCCPTYECVGCKEEEKVEGKCPCAEGAIIRNLLCECVDKKKHLVDGKCICDPKRCPIPELCDKKSVAVTVREGCCKKTVCKPCPSDSESTNIERDEIEDHCVCLPCKTECGYNRTVVIKKHGNGYPGNCCDLYECKKPEEIESTQGCTYGNVFYENGKEWRTQDSQICNCDNGLALCSNPKEEEEQGCFFDNVFYKHTETWTKDDGCTTCSCENGEPNCISHYCNDKVIQVNHSCIRSNQTYHHGEMWQENNGCIQCTCFNGSEKCISDLCDNPTTTTKPFECQPLTNCTKSCLNGFKVTKRGCEICKCNAVRLGQDILSRYNISMNDLIHILDEYKSKKGVVGTTMKITTTPVVTTTTPGSKTIEVVTQVPVVIMNRNVEFLEESSSSSTTEPSIRPTNKETDSLVYIITLVIACCIFVGVIGVLCVYKRGRKSSVDLTNCHYQSVNNHNNNNTIKKTDQLL